MITEAVAASEHNSQRHDCVDAAYVRRLTEDFVMEHSDGGRLEFAHVSVKDYLQGAHRSEYSKIQCHAEVALMCIKHVSSQHSVPFEENLRESAFLQYAHEHWTRHCALLSEKDRQSFGISKELYEWIFGSGSKTFDVWSYFSSDYIYFSETSESRDLLALIFLACEWNLVEVLKQLLSEPAAQYSNISTNGSNAAIKLLSMTDDDEWTPLICASVNGYIEVVKFLIEKGADVSAVFGNKITPLHFAAERGNIEIVKLLVEKDADIKAVDGYGRTSLHLASLNGNTEIVTLLIALGAEVKAANVGGKTPLHYASEEGNIEVVKLLIVEGAEVNVADIEGRTPLSWASDEGHIEVVKLLIRAGADTNGADVEGRTPLDWASEGGHIEAIKLLERAMNRTPRQ